MLFRLKDCLIRVLTRRALLSLLVLTGLQATLSAAHLRVTHQSPP